MTTHTRTPPNYRAAMAAGQHLLRKDDAFAPLVKAIEDHSKATGDRLGTVDGRLAEMSERMSMLEQKSARGGGPDPMTLTWGEQFVQSPEGKALLMAGMSGTQTRFQVGLHLKTTITSATGSGGDLVVPTRDPVVMGLPRRRLTVRGLLNVARTDSGSIEYVRQTTRTSNAAPVAEAAAKPESAYGFELLTAPVRTIAHWVPASRQILDDAPQLRGLIDSELLYGLALVEEAQLLNGDGTGQNLLGLVTVATAYAAPITPVEPLNQIDVIALAILQAALADLPADGAVVHPSDWMTMRLLKDADGRYIMGPPNADVAPRLFGLPVVETPAMGVDNFLVGNFRAAATLYDRWDARVEVGYINDQFTKNLVSVLAEERLALAVKQPAALITGDFTTALAA